MAGGLEVGSAYVSIFPKFAKGFKTQIESNLVKPAADGGKRASKEISGALGKTASASRGLSRVLAQPFRDMVAGFRDSRAAASAFTGVAGTLGGKLRAGLDSGLQPLKSLGARVAPMLEPVTSRLVGWGRGLGQRLQPAFDGLGGRLQSALSKAVGKFGSVFAGVTRAAGAAVSGIGVAIGGIALKGGFERALRLENAQAKLKGLGHDAESVAAIMSSANEAVSGTAFSLDQAASVAASAVAAGIKPGADLTRTLKLVGDAAQIAGTDMGSMGSIFNKVAASGKLQGEVIAQLSDAGIPVLQLVAKELGVTAEEASKMASNGEVSFETFQAAMEHGLGGAALKAGDTFSGAMANVRAALSRMGAKFATPVLNGLRDLFNALIPVLKSVEATLNPVVEAFASRLNPVVERVVEWLRVLNERLQDSGGFDKFKNALAGVLPLLGVLGAGGLGSVISRIPILRGMLPGLSGGLAALASPLGLAAAAMVGFVLSGSDVEGLVSTVSGVVDGVVAALPGMVDALVQMAPKVVDSLLTAAAGLLGAGAQIVSKLVEGTVLALPVLITGAVALVDGLVEAVLTALPVLVESAWPVVGALVQGIMDALPVLVEGAVALVSGLVQAIIDNLPLLLSGALALVLALVDAIVQNLPVIVDGAIALLTALIDGLLGNIPALIDTAIELVLALVEGIVNALPQLVGAAIQLIIALVSGLLSALPQIIGAAIQIVVALVAGLLGAIPRIVAALPRLVSAIKDGFTSVDWGAIGSNIIEGIKNGLTNFASGLVEAAKGVASRVMDGFKSFFGIHSPSRLMRDQVGRQIGAGMALGIRESAQNVAGEVEAVSRAAMDAAKTKVGQISSAVGDLVGFNTPTTANSAGAGGQGVWGRAPITQNNYLQGVDPQLMTVLLGRGLEGLVRA